METPQASTNGSEFRARRDEDVEMGESEVNRVNEQGQPQLPNQDQEIFARESRHIISDDHYTKVNVAPSRDPCGTPMDLKVRFEERVAELDTGGSQTVSPSWRAAAGHGDEEDENLIPISSAPEVEKPKIVDSSFEEQIKKLLKTLESKFPARSDHGNETDKSNELEMSSNIFDESDDAYVPDDSVAVFPVDSAKLDSVQENANFMDKILERLKDPEFQMAIDDFDYKMEEVKPVRERMPESINPIDDRPGPSRRNVKTVLKFEDMDVSEEDQESAAHVPTDLDEMLMLPSLDSEDDRILADIDSEIKALPLSHPPSQHDTEFAVPATVLENGVVLPVVENLFDDTSTVPGTADDETTTSGTFYEEALLPEIQEENNLSGSLSDFEMATSELSLENETIGTNSFAQNVTQLSNVQGVNQTISHNEDNLPNLFCGANEIIPSPMLHVDNVVPSIDEVFPAENSNEDEEDSVVSSSEEVPNCNLVPVSPPIITNRKLGREEEGGTRLPVVLDEDTEELFRNLRALPKAGTVGLPVQRRYDLNSVISWEEDHLREFKGHRDISQDEVPPWSSDDLRTRSPISRESSVNSRPGRTSLHPGGGFVD